MDLPKKGERALKLDLISKLPLIFILSIRLNISNATCLGIFRIPCFQGLKNTVLGVGGRGE